MLDFYNDYKIMLQVKTILQNMPPARMRIRHWPPSSTKSHGLVCIKIRVTCATMKIYTY